MAAVAGLTTVPTDAAALKRASQALQAGRLADAEAALRDLSAAGRAGPEALFLSGVCANLGGQTGDALALFDRALKLAPQHAGIWFSRGNLLNRMGDVDGAVGSFGRAVALAPGYLEAWLNMASVGVAAQRWDVAAPALERARAIAPRDGRVLLLQGLLAQADDKLVDAEAAFRAALALNPADARAGHNLAAVLRALGQTEAALVVVEAAMRVGKTLPETATLRGHLLAELGRFDAAIEQYRAVIAAVPSYLDAQETLADLLPQVGRSEEALSGYATALDQSAGAALWLSAINAARAVGDASTMLRWAEAAAAAFGPAPEWTLARIGALTLRGDRDAAIAVAEAQDPRSASVEGYLAYLYLQAGNLAAAEAAAVAATRLDPADQASWALLTVIWRLTGDGRADWLADYDRLVMVADLIVPHGWNSLDAFMADLREVLTRLHLTNNAPANQSLRAGTQTRGRLFDRCEPVLVSLKASLLATVEAELARLEPEAGHPFLGKLTGKVTMAGSWSVRLASKGFHVSHIHPSGWLSSAFYVSVPAEVGLDAGSLLFGVPDAALGIDLPPARVVVPKAGQLVIFPSYFWHGTAGFESNDVRMSVAFDALARRGEG